MTSDNGRILGPDNTPTTTVASGVWGLDELYEARLGNIWPSIFVPPIGPVAAYFAGGAGTGTSLVNSIQKFIFATDARVSVTATLSGVRAIAASFASSVAGYVAGGSDGVAVSTVDKIALPAETRSTLGTGLSANRSQCTGSFASDVAGYVPGGRNGSIVSTVEKFAFSNDARSTLGTGLSSARRNSQGFGSNVAGYVAGGQLDTLTTSGVTTVDKFAFSNDARSTLGTGLNTARGHMNAQGLSSDIAGYIGGGLSTSGARLASIEKFVFSNDSRTVLSATLDEAVDFAAGTSSSDLGYFAGGRNAAGVSIAKVNKIDFSTDSRSTLSTGLSAVNRQMMGFSG